MKPKVIVWAILSVIAIVGAVYGFEEYNASHSELVSYQKSNDIRSTYAELSYLRNQQYWLVMQLNDCQRRMRNCTLLERQLKAIELQIRDAEKRLKELQR